MGDGRTFNSSDLDIFFHMPGSSAIGRERMPERFQLDKFAVPYGKTAGEDVEVTAFVHSAGTVHSVLPGGVETGR